MMHPMMNLCCKLILVDISWWVDYNVNIDVYVSQLSPHSTINTFSRPYFPFMILSSTLVPIILHGPILHYHRSLSNLHTIIFMIPETLSQQRTSWYLTCVFTFAPDSTFLLWCFIWKYQSDSPSISIWQLKRFSSGWTPYLSQHAIEAG